MTISEMILRRFGLTRDVVRKILGRPAVARSNPPQVEIANHHHREHRKRQDGQRTPRPALSGLSKKEYDRRYYSTVTKVRRMDGRQGVRLGKFVKELAQEAGVTPSAIWMRLYRGRMPWPEVKRINRRVVLIKGDQ